VARADDREIPKSHKFTIGDRIESIALNVLEALIEATHTKERTQHLRQANLGLDKLRYAARRSTGSIAETAISTGSIAEAATSWAISTSARSDKDGMAKSR
jgi:hypothetical protein